ncbi:uncharacterized protein METZ01_LOCUS315136, partial [marine metagenome]
HPHRQPGGGQRHVPPCVHIHLHELGVLPHDSDERMVPAGRRGQPGDLDHRPHPAPDPRGLVVVGRRTGARGPARTLGHHGDDGGRRPGPKAGRNM